MGLDEAAGDAEGVDDGGEGGGGGAVAGEAEAVEEAEGGVGVGGGEGLDFVGPDGGVGFWV